MALRAFRAAIFLGVVTASTLAAAQTAPPAVASTCTIPAGTIAEIEVVDMVTSHTAKIGDSFAIRLASDFIHPTVFTRDGPQMTGSMFAAFCTSWAAITLLAYVMYRTELAGKRTDLNLRELREALAR